MTIKQVLQAAEDMRPGGLAGGIKIGWINELEGRIVRELYRGKAEYADIDFTGYPANADTDTVLLVPDEYAGVYVYWILMKADYANNETERFNNDAILYNTAYLAYANYVNRTASTAKDTRIKLC